MSGHRTAMARPHRLLPAARFASGGRTTTTARPGFGNSHGDVYNRRNKPYDTLATSVNNCPVHHYGGFENHVFSTGLEHLRDRNSLKLLLLVVLRPFAPTSRSCNRIS